MQWDNYDRRYFYGSAMDKESLTLYYETQLQLLKIRLESLQELEKHLTALATRQMTRHNETNDATYWLDARATSLQSVVIDVERQSIESQLHYLTTKLVELLKPAN